MYEIFRNDRIKKKKQSLWKRKNLQISMIFLVVTMMTRRTNITLKNLTSSSQVNKSQTFVTMKGLMMTVLQSLMNPRQELLLIH